MRKPQLPGRQHLLRWMRVLLVMPLLLAAPSGWAARLALVIGNSAYADVPLKNPVNDARAMEQKLTSLGFKVQKLENLKRQQIGRTVTAFASSIKPGDEVVVFYAGHDVQVKGVNYLPAVDADIQSEEDVPLNSLNLNTLMERLDEAKAGLKLFFLDACRNNPYARSFRSGDRGLARVSAAPSGTLIHFATRPGSVAADGSGANGLHTSLLLRHIDTPHTPVETMLKRVAAAVEAESKGQQEPWTEGSIRGEFFFNAGGTTLASVKPEPIRPTMQPSQAAGVSLEDWQPKQCHRFFAGVTTSDASASSWNGQRPSQSLPAFFSTTPEASTKRSTLTWFFNRSSSVSGMRGICGSPRKNFLHQANVLENLAGVLYPAKHSRFRIEHASVDFPAQIRHHGSIEHRFGGWSAGYG